MLAEKKVQIEAIKTKEYMAGKINDTIMFTNREIIIYIPEKDCLIDISKIKEIPKARLEELSTDKIENLLKPIELTKKAIFFGGITARLFEDKETGDRIWINDKYLKMFKGYNSYSANIGGGMKPIVFTRNDKIVGLVLPVRISGNIEF